MTGKGHIFSGLALSASTFVFAKDIGAEPILATIFFIFGSSAPDWLEIRKKNGGTVIKHRTITHWTPLWLLLAYFSYYAIVNNIVVFQEYSEYHMFLYSIFLGFSFGGLLHLLVDLPNPMGIPILTPYHRFSLNLWKSGKNETFIIISLFIFNLYYLKIINFDLNQVQQIIG